ncbi:minor capsid protein [Listeria booriae]|uniref:minor capsid protein n=1 Tax=Listeria booriae TaxID=1552123 RepID=UPI001628D576|nr:minor capsid protein [Listeria booriae]MBC2190533.1 capsid protein [Listeria booriae]
MGVKVNINLDGVKKKLGKKNLEKGKYALANQALADMNQFIPADSYLLRQVGAVAADGSTLIWKTPYAKRLFYNQFSNYTTPGTGPRWDLEAKSMFMSDWLTAFKKGCGL